MRKILLFTLLAGIAAFPASAQKSKKHTKAIAAVAKAPDVVKQAFQQNFATATDVNWHKMASGNWFAEFSQDSLQTKAEYTPDGQWVATRTALAETSLPDTVLNAIKIKYPTATIDHILRIQRADVAPYYQIALQVDSAEKDILANDAGSITE